MRRRVKGLGLGPQGGLKGGAVPRLDKARGVAVMMVNPLRR